MEEWFLALVPWLLPRSYARFFFAEAPIWLSDCSLDF